MIKNKFATLAGLCNVIGFTIIFPCINDSSGILIITCMVITIISSGIFLSASEKGMIHKNTQIASKVSFISWLALLSGIGHLFSPLFYNMGGPSVGQYLYFASGIFLVIFMFFSNLIAHI